MKSIFVTHVRPHKDPDIQTENYIMCRVVNYNGSDIYFGDNETVTVRDLKHRLKVSNEVPSEVLEELGIDLNTVVIHILDPYIPPSAEIVLGIKATDLSTGYIKTLDDDKILDPTKCYQVVYGSTQLNNDIFFR